MNSKDLIINNSFRETYFYNPNYKYSPYLVLSFYGGIDKLYFLLNGSVPWKSLLVCINK